MGYIGLRLEIILWDVFRNNYGIYLQKQWDIYNFVKIYPIIKPIVLAPFFGYYIPCFFLNISFYLKILPIISHKTFHSFTQYAPHFCEINPIAFDKYIP